MISFINYVPKTMRVTVLLIALFLSETVQQSTDDSTTVFKPTCPPYDSNVYVCVCGATSCNFELITTTARPTTPPFPSNELDNDFENGNISPWVDESSVDNVRWVIQNINSPSSPAHPPQPASGVRYLQLIRSTKPGSFAVAKLRSPEFTVSPGDYLNFNYWIHSKYNNFNNLEVYIRNGTLESRVSIRLSNYSTPNNQQWKNENIILNVASVTNISLVFYGYCGSDAVLDSIAIDDIQVFTSFVPTTIIETTTDSCCSSTTNPTGDLTFTTTYDPGTGSPFSQEENEW